MSSQDTWVDGVDGADATGPGATSRYEPRNELGRGAMGVVSEVFDSRLKRVVARKTLHREGREGEFRREAQVAAALEHPGIVPIYEASEGPDGPWYSMRRIEGRSLAEALSEVDTREARLTFLPAFLRLCEAMAYAHARGVVHRDLKPANVMLGDFGEVMVVDFGLAVSAEEAQAGRIAGTPAYMSPEAARGERPTPQMDVWSLGGVLYELLAGRPPFLGLAPAVLKQLVVEAPPPLPEGCPPELTAIVAKAMSRDLSVRYPDADALRADVEAFTTGRLVEAHDYTSRELLRRFVKQYRGYLVLGAVAVGMVVLTVGAAWWRTTEERDRALRAEGERTLELARSLEERARALGGDPGAAVVARQALELDPGLPWARGVLSEFSGGLKLRRVRQVDGGACVGGREASGYLVALCGDELQVISRDGVILDRAPWSRRLETGGPGWVGASSIRGMKVARIGSDGSIAVQDHPVQSGADVMVLTVAEDGEPLALGSKDGELVVQALEGDRFVERLRMPGGPASKAVRGPTGHQILVHGDGSWLCEPGFSSCERLSFPGVVQHALWANDGAAALLVSTSGEALVLDRESRRLTFTTRSRAGGLQDLLLVAGMVVTVDVTGRVELFDTTGALLGQIDGSAIRARALARAGDDRFWVVGSGGMELWGFERGVRPVSMRLPNGVNGLVVEGGRVFVSFDREVLEVQAGGLSPMWQAGSFIKDLARADGTLLVCSATTGVAALRDGQPPELWPEHSVRRCGMDPDHLVWSTYDDRLYIDGERSGFATSGDLAVRSGRVIFEAPGSTVQVLDLESRKLVFEYPASQEVWAVAIAEGGRQAAFALEDLQVRLVDFETGEIRVLPDAHRASIAGLAFSPSGHRLASASWDGTSRIWEDGELLAALEAHQGRVTHVAFASDDTLYTGSWDHTVRVWDLTAWEAP